MQRQLATKQKRLAPRFVIHTRPALAWSETGLGSTTWCLKRRMHSDKRSSRLNAKRFPSTDVSPRQTSTTPCAGGSGSAFPPAARSRVARRHLWAARGHREMRYMSEISAASATRLAASRLARRAASCCRGACGAPRAPPRGWRPATTQSSHAFVVLHVTGGTPPGPRPAWPEAAHFCTLQSQLCSRAALVRRIPSPDNCIDIQKPNSTSSGRATRRIFTHRRPNWHALHRQSSLSIGIEF